MGLGCGVRLSLSGFDHTIASSIKKQKNSAGQNRLSLLHSHYAHCLSPRSVSRPLLFFPSSCSLFISITHIQSLFFFSPFSFMTPPQTHTHLFIYFSEDSWCINPNHPNYTPNPNFNLNPGIDPQTVVSNGEDQTKCPPFPNSPHHVACTGTQTHNPSLDQQALSALIWINWQWF